jgi:hypothetical protein
VASATYLVSLSRKIGIVRESMSRINNYTKYPGPLAVLERPNLQLKLARLGEESRGFCFFLLAQKEAGWFLTVQER